MAGRVRRRAAAAVCGTLIFPVLQFVSPEPVTADIFMKRDRYGVLHFTNVPADKTYKVVMREAIIGRTSGLGRTHGARIDSSRFDPIIAEMSSRYQVEQALVKAVIRAESSFQPHAVSPKGARGLMQLMPGTALMHRVLDIHEPAENIRGGVQHLRMLLQRYQGNVVKAIAAYNAGEDAVDRHNGIPPYAETREYVWRVLNFRQQYLQQALALAR